MPASLTERFSGEFLDAGGAVFNVLAPRFNPSGLSPVSGTDITAALQAALDAAAAEGADTSRTEIAFPAGWYRYSSALSISMSRLKLTALGKVRLQPMDAGGGMPAACFDFTTFVEELEIDGFTFYSFGESTIACRFQDDAYRQIKVRDCYFVGGSGIQKTNSDNGWRTTIEGCRFQNCARAVEWNVGGQTLAIRDTLFFDSSEWDLYVTNGTQVNLDNCVFESQSAAGKSIYSTCSEVTFIGCQSERTGRDATKTGVDGDFDMQFTGERVTMIGSRFWGGGMGSVAPYSSRNYGILLDGATLELKNSRIYSFTEEAIRCTNGSTILCDSTSWVDYRTTAERIVSTVDLGPNLIQAGNCERWHTHGNYDLPFGWYAVNSGFGSSTIHTTTADFQNEDTVAALRVSGGSGFRTNRFTVYRGDWLALRVWISDYIGGNYGARFRLRYDNGGAPAYINPSKGGTNGHTGDGYLVLRFDLSALPLATDTAYIEVDDGAWTLGTQFEQMGLYRVRIEVAAQTDTYSDNDGNYAGNMDAGPLLPYKPKPLEEHVLESASVPTTGSPSIGDQYRVYQPLAAGYQGARYTSTGWKRFGTLEA